MDARMGSRENIEWSGRTVVESLGDEQPGLYIHAAEQGVEGSRNLGSCDERGDTFRIVPGTNRKNEQCKMNAKDHPRPHRASMEQSSSSPRARRVVSIAMVASLMARRGLLCATTNFMISTQCFAHISDLPGVS